REQRAKSLEVRRRERLVFDELRDELLGGAVKEFVEHSAERISARRRARDLRHVAVRLAFGGVRHELLRLEVAEDREHGGVGEIGGELGADLRDGPRAEVPEHSHDVQLAVAEYEIVVHAWPLLWS